MLPPGRCYRLAHGRIGYGWPRSDGQAILNRPRGLRGLAALAAGCGGGGTSSNGEAAKSAAAVFSDARHAAVAAKSVHVAGALNDSGKALALDLVLAHGKGKGTMAESGLSFQIVRVGNAAYIKGTDAFLASSQALPRRSSSTTSG